MTGRPSAVVDIGRWTVTVKAPAALLPSVRRALAELWSWDVGSRCVRARVHHAADVIDRLTTARVPHTVRGDVPAATLVDDCDCIDLLRRELGAEEITP